MRKSKFLLACGTAFSLLFSHFCEADSTSTKLDISGTASIVEGQYVKGYLVGPLSGPMPYPIWLHRAYAKIQLDAYIGDRLHIIVAPEVKLWSGTHPYGILGDESGFPARQWSDVGIADGEGIISFGDVSKPFLQFAAGIMPFKYNPDAYNLGEYLFRSGTYPTYVITSFDYAYSRVSGLHLSSTLFKNLHQDLLLTTETQVLPLLDWSLSYLVNYKVPSLIDVGAGISLYRIFPAAGVLTTPNKPENQFTNENGEKEYYTFQGTKLMGRVTIDPKGFLPKSFSGLFGSEDGKVFAEAAILGTKDYTATVYDSTTHKYVPDSLYDYYGDISQRIPIMFGINVPVFKILDVLSVQGEWFKWPHINSLFSQVYHTQYPVPVSTSGIDNPDDLKNGTWKWSVYAKKEVIKGFTLIGQVARDHTFHEYYYGNYRSEGEVFIKNPDWGWWLKLQYGF
jgi:hypothetical protein